MRRAEREFWRDLQFKRRPLRQQRGEGDHLALVVQPIAENLALVEAIAVVVEAMADIALMQVVAGASLARPAHQHRLRAVEV